MSTITFGNVPHPEMLVRPISKPDGMGQNYLGQRTVKGVGLRRFFRKVQRGKFTEVINGSGVVRVRCFNDVKERTDALALDVHNPAALLCAPTHAPESTYPLATTVVATIFANRRKAHVLASAVKPIAVDVVNDQTFRGVHDVAMEVNMSVVSASTDATSGVPTLAAPTNRPLVLKDSRGILGTDDRSHAATQGDNYGIVTLRHFWTSFTGLGGVVARSVSSTAGLFSLPKLYQKGA